MELLKDIITYLANQGLVEGDGIDAFRDIKPESPDNIVSLFEYSGDPLSQYTDTAHRSVQVVVRNKSAAVAHAHAVRIFNSLRPGNDNLRIDFTPTRWGQVHIRQYPFKISHDEQDRVSYGFNLGITTQIQ